MFAQFRSRYPTGGLISELLAIDHGQYVVRVLVEVDSVIISSGLAAAETVELAEDQARKRSLQVLGIETSTALPNFSTTRSLAGTENSTPFELNSAPEPAQLPEASVPESRVETSSSPSELEDWSSGGTSSDDWLSATYLNPSSSSPSPTTEASSTSPTKGRSASLPPLPDTPSEESHEVPSPSEDHSPQSSTSKTSKKKKPQATIESTDFSSEIARTDLELKRLGWTTEQGVEHLQKTYGKRSRHQLTEDELLDFLHYLESLPTPAPHADN
ncbi:hypothetical protein M595_2785 [Lyngbya aestuarii BL J]|uniref:Uncharacterized protein n=1 Tax=Lyngbya aestuarii BL J TaxID=1348334 RepID=U7QGZ9_9CYAN|nr:hypothetical protein [Lyngbya aestuarii]ERT07244.1 hypothetical protein M595_2785 [Lyngbya aestuarii BL J]